MPSSRATSGSRSLRGSSGITEEMQLLPGMPPKAEVGECVAIDPALPPAPVPLQPVSQETGKEWQESVIHNTEQPKEGRGHRE